eukprot:TRINITY_DN8110_c0_g1_i1.p1 TRINITY_DN8110_c0_g1~~TRINITY_DN8110_c0_g1_i1.p1  ORF type:complete len:528 (+),score=87.35 TRINITY_DN8110_c0_g1_i1:81-1664(+)
MAQGHRGVKTKLKTTSKAGQANAGKATASKKRLADAECRRRIGPSPASVGGLPVEESSHFTQLSDVVREPVRQGLWPGAAAAVVVDGHVRLVEEVGFADMERRVPMSTSSLVRLYSMTKCIVAAAVLQLVDEGLLGLDDNLSKHLPAFRSPCVVVEKADGWPEDRPHKKKTEPAKRPITLRHLLTHTSGISGGAAPGIEAIRRYNRREHAWVDIYKPLISKIDSGQITSLSAWVEQLAKLPLWNHPGEHYSYGYSYDVLGHLIELKTGKHLALYLQERIFVPLGMLSTGFDLLSVADSADDAPSESTTSRLTALYRRTKASNFGADGKTFKLVRVDPQTGKPSQWSKQCQVPSAGGCVSSFAGGLLSSLDDYAKFLLAVVSGGAHPSSGVRILSERMAAEMLADQTAKLRGSSERKGPAATPDSASPYGNQKLGLSCLGEVQRPGAPSTGGWFDGVAGVRLWGGAANTAFKFDPNRGRPILVIVMSQVVPQDSGITATALLEGARHAAKCLTDVPSLRRRCSVKRPG